MSLFRIRHSSREQYSNILTTYFARKLFGAIYVRGAELEQIVSAVRLGEFLYEKVSNIYNCYIGVFEA